MHNVVEAQWVLGAGCELRLLKDVGISVCSFLWVDSTS